MGLYWLLKMIANSTCREAKLRSNGLMQVKMENGKSLHKDYPHIRVLAGFVGSGGVKYGAENSSILGALEVIR